MSLSVESFIPSGSGLLVQIVLLVGAWFKFQNKVENLENSRTNDLKNYETDRKEDRARHEEAVARIKEVNALQWAKIDELGKWNIVHEKEAWENRNALELKIAALHGADEKLEAMLLSIEKKLDSLIDKFEKK